MIYSPSVKLEIVNWKMQKQPLEKGSVKKVLLEIEQNSQEKNLCWGLFFNKVADMRPATLLKKRL